LFSKVWKNYEEPKEEKPEEEPTERKANFRSVYVTEVTPQLHLYCQFADSGSQLDRLMEQVELYCLSSIDRAYSMSRMNRTVRHWRTNVDSILSSQ